MTKEDKKILKEICDMLNLLPQFLIDLENERVDYQLKVYKNLFKALIYDFTVIKEDLNLLLEQKD